jgi:hypothetical protein
MPDDTWYPMTPRATINWNQEDVDVHAGCIFIHRGISGATGNSLVRRQDPSSVPHTTGAELATPG